jgi:glycosyltransferase involved in cell wall biosynthesis
MLNLLNRYSKESPDIIHIQWLLFYQFDYFWLRILRYRLRRKNTKIVLTAHNVLPHINGYKYKNILEKIYSQVDGIIVHSEVLKEQMIKIFGEKVNDWSICVIPHGANYKLLEKVNKDILNDYIKKIKLFKAERYNFLFAGTIHKNKGLDILLKAWKEHINRYSKDKLFIIGKPDYNLSYELQLAKSCSSSIIISLGYKSDEELVAYFLECDFVVLPYKEASQSGVLLTALSLGKPVIVTKVGALPEIVNIVKCGYIVEPNNPKHLYLAINKASEITRDKLIKWNDAIKYKTNKYFSLNNIAKLTYNFYKELFI